jgi:hypothetical protein
MDEFVYIVPTRGRPQNAARLVKAFANMKTYEGTRLIFAIDEDDTSYGEYVDVFMDVMEKYDWVSWVDGPRLRMNGTLNAVANSVVLAENVYALGFMGDDHEPLTHGWDTAYLQVLRAGAFVVYGDDTIQHEAIPTQIAMRADIVRAIGYMAPPVLVHLYMDNFWYDIAEKLGGRAYLPSIVVRHHHPIAAAAEWDQTYIEANANHADGERYLEYVGSGQLDADAAKVRAYVLSETA